MSSSSWVKEAMATDVLRERVIDFLKQRKFEKMDVNAATSVTKNGGGKGGIGPWVYTKAQRLGEVCGLGF